MEKQQIREELMKVNSEIKELLINLSGLKSKRADLLSQLCDELQTILEKRSMDPYLVWNGKLSSGKVKFEELRIYFTNFRNFDKEEEVPEIKVAEVTEELPEEKSKVKKSKGKKKYIKFLDIFTQLNSDRSTITKSDIEILNNPVWTRIVKHDPSEKPETLDKNKDFFVTKGSIISLECLKEICFILSISLEPKETRQLVKEVLERYGYSCNIDSLSVEKPSRKREIEIEIDENIIEEKIKSDNIKEKMTDSEIAETLF